MKIYTLENKNEVLAILTHQDNISYRKFKEIYYANLRRITKKGTYSASYR